MFGRLLLLFIMVPLADLFLLMVMSAYTGWPFSITMVVLSGLLGAYLAQRSSAAVGRKIRQRLATGGMSPDLLTDGAMIFFAAGLLLTPGFITDAVGLTLLIPVCRQWYKRKIMAWLKRNVKIQIVTPGENRDDDRTVDGAVHKPVDSTRCPGDDSRSLPDRHSG